MRSFLIIDAQPPENLSKYHPESILLSYGYQVHPSGSEAIVRESIQHADAMILHLPLSSIETWGNTLVKQRSLPIFWWCSTETAQSSLQDCEVNVSIDGVLTPSMTEQELHWSLHFGEKRFFERQHWHSEREQLHARLEERKWIDKAKGILGQINGIPEAEAYDVLRKKAMNDRKRIVDVAISIVKAHEMLRA